MRRARVSLSISAPHECVTGARSGPFSPFKVKSAYIVGELCALNADGVPVFSRLQAAMDKGRTDQLVFFVFDLLFLNGESTAQMPLNPRKRNMSEAEQPDLYEPDGLWPHSANSPSVHGSPRGHV